MNKRNFQKELDQLLTQIEQEKRVPTLLLHSCCAPCSSYVLGYLSKYFKITVFYYNPNIYPEDEYYKRVKEQQEFIQKLPTINPVAFLEGEFDPAAFYHITKGFEKEKEGSLRCFQCYKLRLKETAKLAREKGFEFFTTTLSISPLKNAEKLNEIGEEIGKETRVPYLNSDFKKKNGYKRSVELSQEYGLYRQTYCGCVFSKNQ